MNDEKKITSFEDRMNYLKLKLAEALKNKNNQEVEYYSKMIYMHKQTNNSDANKKLLGLLKKK